MTRFIAALLALCAAATAQAQYPNRPVRVVARAGWSDAHPGQAHSQVQTRL